MEDYLFFLGRDIDLSKLELLSYFDANNIKYSIKEDTKEVMLISLNNLDFAQVIRELGGTVKIAKVIDQENFDPLTAVKWFEKSVTYGVSFYTKRNLRLLGTIKKRFKEEGLKAYLKKPQRLSYFMPSEVIKHKFLENGFELVVFNDHVGYTIAVFNPKEYINRDDKRPFFDEKMVVSIRLANILINLSKVKKEQTLLDPFCGVGTILQEALLRNINVIGADLDGQVVKGCKKNMEWITKRNSPKAYWKVFNVDSRKISAFIGNVDVVVTEPYLGPYLRKTLNLRQAKIIRNKLHDLYSELFLELARVVKSRIVFITPVFVTNKNQKVGVNFTRIFDEAGFEIAEDYGIRVPIVYKHESSRFDRKIWILKRK